MPRKTKEEFGPSDWYSARLLYECLPDPMPKRQSKYPWFEEIVVVFQPGDRESVRAKLKELAGREETEYETIGGRRRWVFREVLEVQDVMTDKGIADGTEAYFRWWYRPGPALSR